MEEIRSWGLELIIGAQTLRTPLVDAAFQAITFLGDTEFYLLLAPIVIWCIDYRLGARLGILLLLSGYLNELLKGSLGHPRPCDLEPKLCLIDAEGYGLPSGHSQNAVVLWGAIAQRVGRRLAWTVAAVLMVLIGLSRIYLGVHFPSDVAGGWAVGVLILAPYLMFGSRIERWLQRRTLVQQLALALAPPLAMLALGWSEATVRVAGAWMGLTIGFALTTRYLHFAAGGPLLLRLSRFLIGVLIVAGIFVGLRTVFPQSGEPLYAVFRFVRYAMLGLWISWGAPWLFLRMRLADADMAIAPPRTR